MSRRFTGPLRTILPVVVAGLVALGITGCSSGQVTQTDSVLPAVNGNQGGAGDVLLRDVLVSYPAGGKYSAGDDAPLTLMIVNTGGTDDELTAVSSPAATDVELVGTGALPARAAMRVIVPPAAEEPTSEAPSSEPSASPSESPSESPSAEPSGTESVAPPTETTTPEPTPSAAAPEIGTMSIVLTGLTKDLPMGKNVPITFVFAEAGEVTINVPIATPSHSREDAAAE